MYVKATVPLLIICTIAYYLVGLFSRQMSYY